MENFKREIFEQLGNLFYALAADQHISPMASGELKMLLRKDWLTEAGHQSDDKISEAAHLIGLTIDIQQNEKVPAEQAYDSFRKFYLGHREQFAHALKLKIFETAAAIVKMFPSRGQENLHMENLQDLLSLSPQNNENRGQVE